MVLLLIYSATARAHAGIAQLREQLLKLQGALSNLGGADRAAAHKTLSTGWEMLKRREEELTKQIIAQAAPPRELAKLTLGFIAVR